MDLRDVLLVTIIILTITSCVSAVFSVWQFWLERKDYIKRKKSVDKMLEQLAQYIDDTEDSDDLPECLACGDLDNKRDILDMIPKDDSFFSESDTFTETNS